MTVFIGRMLSQGDFKLEPEHEADHAEITRLRTLLAEVSDAFTVVWINDDHNAWDGKAVKRFDALLVKINSEQPVRS